MVPMPRSEINGGFPFSGHPKLGPLSHDAFCMNAAFSWPATQADRRGLPVARTDRLPHSILLAAVRQVIEDPPRHHRIGRVVL